MDDRGSIYNPDEVKSLSEKHRKAYGLVPIEDADVEDVRKMNRQARRKWHAKQRRKHRREQRKQRRKAKS